TPSSHLYPLSLHDALPISSAVQTYLGLAVDRHADYNSMCQSWDNSTEKVGHTFGRQAIAMSWDYCEVNPFSGKTGDFTGQLEWRSEEHTSELQSRSDLVCR